MAPTLHSKHGISNFHIFALGGAHTLRQTPAFPPAPFPIAAVLWTAFATRSFTARPRLPTLTCFIRCSPTPRLPACRPCHHPAAGPKLTFFFFCFSLIAIGRRYFWPFPHSPAVPAPPVRPGRNPHFAVRVTRIFQKIYIFLCYLHYIYTNRFYLKNLFLNIFCEEYFIKPK